MVSNPTSTPGEHPRAALHQHLGAGLFITATGTNVGKTVVTAALAGALHRLHVRVGICKPVSAGCGTAAGLGNQPGKNLTDDDLLAPDPQFAARAAGLDDPALLPYLAPVRFAAPVSPHLASQVEGRPIHWGRIAAAFDFWQENSDLLLVEGAGGWYVPLEPQKEGVAGSDFMIADLAATLRLPVLVVTTPELGSINQTLLTIQAIRQKSLPVVGLVINRVPEPGRRDLATQSNLEELPRLSGVTVRALLPDLGSESLGEVPAVFIEALLPFARELQAQIGRRDPAAT